MKKIKKLLIWMGATIAVGAFNAIGSYIITKNPWQVFLFIGKRIVDFATLRMSVWFFLCILVGIGLVFCVLLNIPDVKQKRKRMELFNNRDSIYHHIGGGRYTVIGKRFCTTIAVDGNNIKRKFDPCAVDSQVEYDKEYEQYKGNFSFEN